MSRSLLALAFHLKAMMVRGRARGDDVDDGTVKTLGVLTAIIGLLLGVGCLVLCAVAGQWLMVPVTLGLLFAPAIALLWSIFFQKV